MFNATIYKNGSRIKKVVLDGITKTSTAYEYGNAVAKAIESYVKDRIGVVAEMTTDSGEVIHRLYVVPKSGTVMVTERGANEKMLSFPFAQHEKLPEKYLIMVNPEMNNNKFYRMVDLGNHTWGAFYARIGEKQGETLYSSHASKPYIYPDYMYAIKLQEKMLKGYRDKTECHKTGTVQKEDVKNFIGIEDPKVAELIEKLMRFAKQTIERNYTVTSADVTPVMIKEAKKEITALRKEKTVKTFNKHLLELLHVIPRRINGFGERGVAAVMAKSENDFPEIILREEALLDVMEGQVSINEGKKKGSEKEMNLLDAMGLEIYVATPDQAESVKKHLSQELLPKLSSVYRVINKRTQEIFNKYLEERKRADGVKVVVKQFWHGSRNENWISIMQKGLLLNPDAKITGKMFGQGVYFAPSSMKSWGYTSSKDAYWNNENSNTAFMALYATAYGKSYEVTSRDASWYNYNYRRLQSKHPECSCVHAKATPGMLKNDEIIFYREDQMTINYICEFNL